MCELILFIAQYYAWFNSTCYHRPPPLRPIPGGLQFFSHLAVYSPPPGTQKETIPHLRHSSSTTNTLFCVQNLNDDIDFRTIAKRDVLTRT